MLRALIPLLMLALTACGSGGGQDSAGAPSPPHQSSPTPFSGIPQSYNGVWTGAGRAYTDNWEQRDLKFRVYIGRTPNAADVNYDIREADGSSFSLGNFNGNFAVGNVLYASDTKKPIGEIGEAGFYFTQSGRGKIEAIGLEDGRLQLRGYLEYGATKIAIDALLSL